MAYIHVRHPGAEARAIAPSCAIVDGQEVEGVLLRILSMKAQFTMSPSEVMHGPGIYLSDDDQEIFLDVLGDVLERFGWLCRAYCLMHEKRPILNSVICG